MVQRLYFYRLKTTTIFNIIDSLQLLHICTARQLLSSLRGGARGSRGGDDGRGGRGDRRGGKGFFSGSLLEVEVVEACGYDSVAIVALLF